MYILINIDFTVIIYLYLPSILCLTRSQILCSYINGQVYSDTICLFPICYCVFWLSQSRKTVTIFSDMWFLYVFGILKKKLFNLVLSWGAFKQVGEVFLPCYSRVCLFPLPHCSTPHHQPPWKNNSNKHDMIIFLITEPGNTKENCGIWRKMPRASQISCCRTFFFLSWILFVTFLAC